MGGWPPSDTRQRTGRFPQRIVALCRSRPPEGKRGSPRSPRESVYRRKCVVCGRNLSSSLFPSFNGQRERQDRFSSSMELLRNVEAGSGVFKMLDKNKYANELNIVSLSSFSSSKYIVGQQYIENANSVDTADVEMTKFIGENSMWSRASFRQVPGLLAMPEDSSDEAVSFESTLMPGFFITCAWQLDVPLRAEPVS